MNIEKYTLKQYTRLIISFFAALVLLSIYQYTLLYVNDTVDSIFGISFLLSVVHHLGYASFAGLVCVPLFNFFENWRPKAGFRIIVGIFLVLLIFEILLVRYYCIMLRPLVFENVQFDLFEFTSALSGSWNIAVSTLLAMIVIVSIFRWVYTLTKKHYHHLAKMYPFTIILLSIFVATLFLDGKPINQNKTQLLAIDMYSRSKETNGNASDAGEFKNDEMVWIQSVFSGKNHDKAYLTAKELAYTGQYQKSLLLSRYILSKVPDHIDTQILMGRINAWIGNFEASTQILNDVLGSAPHYIDAYSALFDVYYWSGNSTGADRLIRMAKAEKIDTTEISEKIARARLQMAGEKSGVPRQIENDNNTNPETVSIAQ